MLKVEQAHGGMFFCSRDQSLCFFCMLGIRASFCNCSLHWDALGLTCFCSARCVQLGNLLSQALKSQSPGGRQAVSSSGTRVVHVSGRVAILNTVQGHGGSFWQNQVRKWCPLGTGGLQCALAACGTWAAVSTHWNSDLPWAVPAEDGACLQPL